MISDPAAIAQALANPATSPTELVELAGSAPEFGAAIAEHPAATIDVLAYLLKHGDADARKAAARRRARDVAQITAAWNPQSESAPATASTAASVSTPEPASVQPAAEPDGTGAVDDELDYTVVSEPPGAPGQVEDLVQLDTWQLVSAGDVLVTFSATQLVVGRKPNAPDSHRNAAAVSLRDPSKTVSKTHAHLELRDGVWHITDLNSTNGVVVDLVTSEKITPNAPTRVTGRFRLGDLEVELTLVEN